MENKESCCSEPRVATILACSGGSNVGQITNEVAKRLDMAGEGKFFCLAGVGGHVSGMIASVEGSDRVLTLDGCPVACAKKVMEGAGIEDYAYVVVTELGIPKEHNFEMPEETIAHVLSVCRTALNGSPVPMEDSNEAKLVETAGRGGSCSGGGCCSCG